MGRRLWDETVHSLCSRSPHGETVVARRAQLREDRLIPLFWVEGGRGGLFEVLAQRAASEGPRWTRAIGDTRFPSPGFGKGGMKLNSMDGRS